MVDTKIFHAKIWEYYRQNKRALPWREHTDPYPILISEIMLQQTQVERVIPKFNSFIEQFPTIGALAKAPLSEVLRTWSGLGYNRRAKYLLQTARMVVTRHGGNLPQNRSELTKLPGIGANTAGAILAYAYNEPVVFIETNIRSVYLHEFYHGVTDVADSELMPLIERTLDIKNPREWYWALMDYGSYIKKMYPNPSRASKHHVKQGAFEGSKRQIRGRIIKLLLEGPIEYAQLKKQIVDIRLEQVIIDLIAEKLIIKSGSVISLAS